MVRCQEVDDVGHAFGGGSGTSANDGSGETRQSERGKQSLDDAKNRAANIESILVKSEDDIKERVI